MSDKSKAEKSQMEGPAAYAPHDEGEKKGQGIVRDKRGQEQPVAKKRAQQTSKTVSKGVTSRRIETPASHGASIAPTSIPATGLRL